MPYIKKKDREKYDSNIGRLVDELVAVGDKNTIKGHHNYVMFMIALKLAKSLGIRYATLQDIIGTFDCCKTEFYRRVLSPYEDKAVHKNGDLLCDGILLKNLLTAKK